MLNTVYRLVEPGRIEAEFCDLDIIGEDVLIRPTHLSICNADQRYYQGRRSPEILKKKLPMALIHEAIGRVVYDPLGKYDPGTRVVMVPNTPVEEDDIVSENYLRSSTFRASGTDGFMQDIVSLRRDRAIVLPEWVDDNVAAFTELVSVCNHTVDRFVKKAHERRNTVGIWGDGNVAFIIALLVKKRLPDSRVIVVGKHEYKLKDFVFADETCYADDMPEGIRIDHGFDCTGGPGEAQTINSIIDAVEPEACLALMGVTEFDVPINTRMILEKGLTLYGSSRCGVKDFENTLAMYGERPELLEYFSRLVGNVIPVSTVEEMTAAFDTDIQKKRGKTIMVWEK